MKRFAEIYYAKGGRVYQEVLMHPDSGFSMFMAGIQRGGGLYLNMKKDNSLSYIPYHSIDFVHFIDIEEGTKDSERMIEYYRNGWKS